MTAEFPSRLDLTFKNPEIVLQLVKDKIIESQEVIADL